MISRSSFLLVLALTTSPLAAQQGDRSEVDSSRPPAHWEIPEAPVLMAEEALETFTLPPGFRIELVASEPLLEDPVAIDFDEDGRIWVVEMQSYMPNVDGRDEIAPVSRVVVLEDTTGDGRMDKSTVFLDNLVLPRAIRVVAGGVLVAEPPHLWFARDTDGDGKADEKTSIFDRYSHRESNPEHGGNGLLLGMDNWIHSAMFDGGRFRLIDGEWVRRPALMRGQWGISHDDFGRHFTNSNSDYLRADLVPNHYYARNPNFPARGGVIPGSLGGVYEQLDSDQRVWPGRITPGVNRRQQLDDEGFLRRFTAACAPHVFRGDRLPEEFRGNAFVAEPAANLIRRAIIEEDESGRLSARNAYERAEFLTSSDERFRPVNIYTAPDGSLYVVDMYRGILQHRQFVTTYLRNQILDRDLDRPLGLGRIYRIVHEDFEPGPAPRLSAATAGELVEYLSHPNGWWRDTAQRLLVERQDQSAVAALREVARLSGDARARIHALWTLEGLHAVDEETVLAALDAEETHLRVAALRVAEGLFAPNGSETWTNLLVALLQDSAPPVRLQSALSAGYLHGERIELNFAHLLARHASQPFLVEAVLSGLPGRELEFLDRLSKAEEWQEEKPERAGVFNAFAGAVMREGKPARINRLIELAVTDASPAWQRVALLDGLEASRVTQLTERPAALGAKPSDLVVARKAAAVFARLEWPGSAMEEELSPVALGLVAKGENHYLMFCAACHQAGGEGMAGMAAPLIGSPWVLEDEANLIRIVLHGKEGENMLMPPMGSLEDDQIAAVLTYIRRSWGHRASPIYPEAVQEIRRTEDRREPWTAEELEKLTN